MSEERDHNAEQGENRAAPVRDGDSGSRLEKIAVHVPGVLYQFQLWPDGRMALPYASAGLRDIYGVDPERVREDATAVFGYVDERDIERVFESIMRSAERLENWHEIHRVKLPGREPLWAEGEATPERQPDGSTLWHGHIRDVTERVQREQERDQLRARVELAAQVFSNSSEGIIVCDADNRIIEVNDGFVRITGFRRDDALGRTPNFLASGRHDAAFYRQMWQAVRDQGSWRGEIWNRRASGAVYAELLSISVIRDENGRVRNYIGVFSDITPLKQHERELRRIANYDHLTGIPNRRLLTDRLTVAINRAQRERSVLAVCYLDLDGFKPINDRFGHDVGDEVLVGITTRLKGAMRGEETLARLGGDEFVLLFNGVDDRDNLSRLLDRVLSLVREPVAAGGMRHCLSASIGVALCPPSDPEPDALLRHADQAMYRAKQDGRDCVVFYDPQQDRELQVRQQRRDRLAQALGNGELFLEYQPLVELASGRALGVEALLRWRHPQQGVLGPLEFLPDIDGSALDVEVGDWVIEAALAQLETWSQAGLALSMSVNISAQHLLSPDFAEGLRRRLQRRPGVRATDLTLEILESTALQDLNTARATISDCRQLGLRIALDDFGTGYSSLAYLRELSVDTLKIDCSFVRDMLDHPGDLDIVESVIGLARAFDRQVVAEGVESDEHGRRLLQLGCELGQGFGIARPMAGDAVAAWVAQRGGARR